MIVDYDEIDGAVMSAAKAARTGILIEGPKNISAQMARRAAKIVLCANGQGEGCGCKACKSFDTGNNPDFSVIEKEKSVIGIDLLRGIKADTTPVVSRKKVVFVPDLGTATEEAQNAILKVLEDDADKVCVIGTYICGNVLPTVRSRMSVFRLKAINDGTDSKHYILSGGDTGEVNECFDGVYEAFKNRDGKALMEALCVLKEKDKKDFFSVYKTDGVRDLCGMLVRAAAEETALYMADLCDREWFDLIKRCGEEERKIGNSYGKLQFYAFIAEIAEMLKGEKDEQ